MENKVRFVLPVDQEIELRLLEEGDATELFSLIDRNREHLRPWLPWVDYEKSVEDSRHFVQRSLQNYLDHKSFDLGIRYRERLSGVIGFHTVNWTNRHVEIGYWLASDCQGHGVMTRACHAMIDFAFYQLQLNRVTILCATGNTRSRAIPERLSFVQEGILRDGEWLYDHFVDLAIYSILAREWNAPNAG
jgi:ribosomal-protein-serine acetyltransferase